MRTILIIASTVVIAAGFASCAKTDGRGDGTAKALFDQAPRGDSAELKAAREMLRSGRGADSQIVESPVEMQRAAPQEATTTLPSAQRIDPSRKAYEQAMLKRMTADERARRATSSGDADQPVLIDDEEG